MECYSKKNNNILIVQFSSTIITQGITAIKGKQCTKYMGITASSDKNNWGYTCNVCLIPVP